jgi:hypothetical protein
MASPYGTDSVAGSKGVRAWSLEHGAWSKAENRKLMGKVENRKLKVEIALISVFCFLLSQFSTEKHGATSGILASELPSIRASKNEHLTPNT